jgi:hypothetical protein
MTACLLRTDVHLPDAAGWASAPAQHIGTGQAAEQCLGNCRLQAVAPAAIKKADMTSACGEAGHVHLMMKRPVSGSKV